MTKPGFDQDVPDQTNAEGDVITGLDAGATDPDGDSLTYAASGLPDGLSINTSSGLISGTLSSTSAGLHHVTVTVTDNLAVDDTDTFDWTVSNTNQEPSFDQDVPDQTNAEGDVITGLDAGATDPDGDSLTYAASGLPDGLSINTSSGLISGTLSSHQRRPAPRDRDRHRQRWPVDDTDTFDWTVSNTNQEPSFDQDVPDQTNAEGDVITGLDAGATDPDGDSLTYAASGLPDGLSINTSSGLISGTLSSTSAGLHHVTVTVTDNWPSTTPTPSTGRSATPTRTSASPVLAPIGDKTLVAQLNAPGRHHCQ